MGLPEGAMYRPRRLPVLLALSLLLGIAYALTLFPLSYVAGTSRFWLLPHAWYELGVDDLGEVVVGYHYLMLTPWGWPLLFAPNLGAPDGTNIFWLDAVPWVSLLGKLAFSLTGDQLNLIGLYDLACFVLPGVVMTALFFAAGQRSLLAAVTATVFGDAAPVLIFRWPGLALSAHFLVIAALALYIATRSQPAGWSTAWRWTALLVLAVLTNMYLFLMVGCCWAATALQRWLQPRTNRPRLLLEAAAAVAAVFVVTVATGIASHDLRYGASGAALLGANSMNLVSMIVPQHSGVIPPLAHYQVGMRSQGEGFAWLGMGALMLLLLSLPAWASFIRGRWREHAVMIALMIAFVLFALSNDVYLGSHLIVAIPLPPAVHHVLGTFRSSGRFSWPVVYALTAGSAILVLRWYRPAVAVPALVLACALQLVDVGPLRHDVAQNIAGPAMPVLDQQRVRTLVQEANAVFVVPSWGCIYPQVDQRLLPVADRFVLLQANMEIQLAAARLNRPINSVDNARVPTDCPREQTLAREPLREGTAYIYLAGFRPDAGQMSGHDPAKVCGRDGLLRYCLIRPAPR